MIYIICAFESEARVLIDSYKLEKTQVQPFVLFCNDEIRLIISGLGQEKAKAAAEYMIDTFFPSTDDAFLNIGICAAHPQFKLGSLLQIAQLGNGEKSYTLECHSTTWPCVSCLSSSRVQDEVISEDIAEMEAFGLYEPIRQHFHADKIRFFKVVSDHFEPFIPKKQLIISLMQEHLNTLRAEIKRLQGGSDEH